MSKEGQNVLSDAVLVGLSQEGIEWLTQRRNELILEYRLEHVNSGWVDEQMKEFALDVAATHGITKDEYERRISEPTRKL